MRRLLAGLLLFLSCVESQASTQAQSDPVSEVIQRVNALQATYGVPPTKSTAPSWLRLRLHSFDGN
ncbi:MAG: hypothetical protein H6667_21440 [Ardenticatenaceae bacterium]|nr:hypothetical protein [Ardenticatenaceae bacterium]MCB9446664.1 hypothetical protein [Ardenticatenaceae bacterium]